MRDVEEAFVADMKAQSAIDSLVRQRVYAYEAGSGAIEPYIVVTNAGNPMSSFTQTAFGGDARISIFCYGKDAAQSRAVGHRVWELYRQRTGMVDDVSVEWLEVSNARLLHGPGGEIRYLVDLIVHYT